MTVTELGFDLEAADPHCLDPEDAARLLAGAPWRRLLVLGDSVAEGVREAIPGYRDLSWAERVADALDAPAYLNLGQRGLLAAEVRELQLGPALWFAPDLAILVAGGNDMLRRSFDPDAVERELDAAVGRLRESGADVVTFGLFDLGRVSVVPERLRAGLSRRRDELDRRTRAVAERHGALHVDYGPHPAASDPGIWSSDGIHANARGHAIIAAEAIRALAGWRGR